MMRELTPLTSWAQASRETIYPEGYGGEEMTLTLSEAAYELRLAGHTVEPSDMVGLVLVDGRELTMNQVNSEAQRAKSKTMSGVLNILATRR